MAIKLFFCVLHDGTAESQRFTELDMRHFLGDYRSVYEITMIDNTPIAATIKETEKADNRRATEFAQYAMGD